MKITAQVDYVSGHLRYGHFEATVPADEIETFNNMTAEEKKEYIRDIGELIVDDYEVDDWGDIGEVTSISTELS